MKKTMLVALMVSLVAGSAFADTVTQSEGREGLKTISINGGTNGAAMEIFTIMDKAGVKATQYIEGKNLLGENLSSYVAFLNGARYGAALTVDTSSTSQVNPNDVVGGSTIIVTGNVAEELFNDMEKAGEARRIYMDGTQYVGTNVLCGSFVRAAQQYSCTIQVR